jgi:SAM-dependent methyltransferase
LDRQQLLKELAKYSFYHEIPLGDGVVTTGDPRFVPMTQLVLRNLRAIPLAGRRVLDVGCNDGCFSFEAERLGAAEVIAIDREIQPSATDFLIPYLGSKVKMHKMNVLDLDERTFGKFDVIIYPGVLYHLRYPFSSLQVLHNVLANRGVLLLETAIIHAWERHPIVYCPTGAESPYEPTSVTFFNEHGMRSTLWSMGFEVTSTDRLYGRKLLGTKGIGPKQFAMAALMGLQNAVPDLVHRIFGRFAIDQGVYVCRRSDSVGDANAQNYWNTVA